MGTGQLQALDTQEALLPVWIQNSGVPGTAGTGPLRPARLWLRDRPVPSS